MSRLSHEPILAERLDQASQKGDVGVAWQAVDQFHADFSSGLYSTQLAVSYVDVLEAVPRLGSKIEQALGLLTLRGLPDTTADEELKSLFGSERHALPPVYGVTESVIAATEGVARRITAVEDRRGEIWKTLHALNAQGYPELKEMVGWSDVVIESTKLTSQEETMLSMWAKKRAEPVPYTDWLTRLTTGMKDAASVIEMQLRDTGVGVQARTERPGRMLPEKLLQYVAADTMREKPIAGTRYTVNRQPFGQVVDSLKVLYEKDQIIATPNQHQAFFVDLFPIFTSRLEKRYLHAAEKHQVPSELWPEVRSRAMSHLQQLAPKYRAISFTGETREQPMHDNNALLVSDDFIEAFWHTIDSSLWSELDDTAQNDEVLLASAEGDVANPYAMLWYGDKYLLTFIPSIISGYSWLHIDALCATDPRDVRDWRQFISKQIRSN